MDAGADLGDTARECVLALVEPVHVRALARVLPLELAVGDVAAHRHPVARVVGEEVEPLLVASRVQQLGLAVQELLDLLLEQESGERGALVAHGAFSSAQLSAPMNWRQRP